MHNNNNNLFTGNERTTLSLKTLESGVLILMWSHAHLVSALRDSRTADTLNGTADDLIWK